jgi:hypothetical protein
VQRAAGTYQVVTFSACYGVGVAATDKVVVAVPAGQGLVDTLGAEGTTDFLTSDESIFARPPGWVSLPARLKSVLWPPLSMRSSDPSVPLRVSGSLVPALVTAGPPYWLQPASPPSPQAISSFFASPFSFH